MADILKDIKAELKEEFAGFEATFAKGVKTKVSLLDTVLGYIVKRKGKQIRPTMVLLSAGCCGDINEKTYRGASLVELLHTATLVHDDVVDESYKRRGFFSINALWKNKVAVLVGDFLLSRGLIIAVENKDFEMLEIVSDAMKRMAEGELLQLEKARKLDIKEVDYYRIISGKTASLFAACCAIGAASITDSTEIKNAMREFGENAGMAFQIKDDLFDFNEDSSGKPKGVDIKEKKMTLPLIYSLNHAENSEKREIIRIFKSKRIDSEKVQKVVSFIVNSGGPEYARGKMNDYKEKALKAIQILPESRYKTRLISVLNYIIERNI
ncbi:MAG: polyprenyl synthetase family protein [Bacteroidetes bacterium]|nr:polyprenyl synthetase family protein [Bacteroidota bacterium]